MPITDGAEPLQRLYASLEEKMLELGCYRKEERGYTPHLTLGRLSHEDRAEEWEPVLAKQGKWQGGSSPVDEVLVMSSEMRRGGPEYSVMGRAGLGG